MKRKLAFNLVTVAAVTVLAALFSSPAFGVQFGENTCDVTNEYSGGGSSTGIPLDVALWYAATDDNNDDNNERCRQTINIQVESIALYQPLIIDGSARPGETAIGGTGLSRSELVIRGDVGLDENGNKKQVRLMPRFREESIPAGLPKCVIRIRGAGSAVTLANIKIVGVPAGWSGVCVDRDQTLLINVGVEGNQSPAGSTCAPRASSEDVPAEGELGEDGLPIDGEGATEVVPQTEENENGFVFRRGSTGSVMTTSCSVSGMRGCAIDFGSGGQNGWISNRLISMWPNEQGQNYSDGGLFDDEVFLPGLVDSLGDVDDRGLIRPDVDGGDSFASLGSSNPSGLFKTSSDVYACVSRKKNKDLDGNSDTTGDKFVEIRGFIVQGSGRTPVTDIQFLHIYKSNGFYGYVGPAETISGYGIRPTRSESERNGYFKFLLPAESNETERYVGRIVLIPENSAYNMGRVSDMIVVKVSDDVGPSDETPCYDIETGEDDLVPGTPGSGGNAYRLTSVEDCKLKRNIEDTMTSGDALNGYFGGNSVFDTDGDGVSDDVEDSGCPEHSDYKWNCNPEDCESNFLRFDTDRDGIPDGTGIIDPENPEEFSGEFGCVERTSEGLCEKLADSDNDDIPNANETDSDNDGRPDTDEDRNDAIIQTIGLNLGRIVEGGDEESSKPGFLYLVSRSASGSIGSAQTGIVAPMMVANGSEGRRAKTCGFTGDGATKGVEYKWARVKKSAQGDVEDVVVMDVQPEDYPPTVTLEEGWLLEVVACKSKALAYRDNFDGKYEDTNNETDAYKDVDSDDDGFCDGDGDACVTGGAGRGTEAPGCATIPAIRDSTNGCGKPNTKPCSGTSDMTVLFTTMYVSGDTYVDFSAEGVPQFKYDTDNVKKIFSENKNASGVPFNFTKLSNSCWDSDQDGIPDCVEVPRGTGCCNEETDLCWNDPDSDGDGYGDGWKSVAGMQVDVCPQSEGDQDMFSAAAGHAYSCGTRDMARRSIYSEGNVEKQALACFLDRDGDTLRDCQEDLNLDGNFSRNNVFSTKDVPITFDILKTIESDPLSTDSDTDGVDDKIECLVAVDETAGRYMNPGNADSDGDTIPDGQENRDANREVFNITIMTGSDLCEGVFSAEGAPLVDTDPTNPDTDGDTLPDNVELGGAGEVLVGDAFIQELDNPETWLIDGGIPMKSNPRSPDSDGDIAGQVLNDNEEYSGGSVTFFDSNPCMRDSDHDGTSDFAERRGSCRLSRGNQGCENVQPGASAGVDSDADGLPDLQEGMLGTYASASVAPAGINPQDSDGDGILDGDEDDGDGIWEPQIEQGEFGFGESHPMKADTDEDGLNDGWERRLQTDPNNRDTDGDGILDGLEDKNHNGEREVTETDAKLVDTDNDGLCDGSCNGIGEDLDVNGERNVDENGNWSETDPTNPDSDMDGEGDYDEMTAGGGWNPNRNIGSAVTGRQGCSMAAGAGEPGSMYFMLGIILAAMRVASRRMRRTPA